LGNQGVVATPTAPTRTLPLWEPVCTKASAWP
jgi:hypothetical protein